MARERDMSLAEVIRWGFEYVTHGYPPLNASKPWSPPKPRHLSSFLTSSEESCELANLPTYDSEER